MSEGEEVDLLSVDLNNLFHTAQSQWPGRERDPRADTLALSDYHRRFKNLKGAEKVAGTVASHGFA